MHKNQAFFLALFVFFCLPVSFAQENITEVIIDLSAKAAPMPGIVGANIDLSGRGFHNEPFYPQALAAAEPLDLWRKDIGFSGLFRIQYNLWEVTQAAKDKAGQEKLLSVYEERIKDISEAGGTVILDIFGTPAGMGRVLDKKSAALNLEAFKETVKAAIKYLSCEKKYNIWYEVWSAPDLGDFFIGREQDYLNMYQAVAHSCKELEAEYKINIPVGGPSASNWFHSLEADSILTPEKSLIYSLIKFCSARRLPLDFITWHGFSSDPKAEKELTVYGKNSVELIRDWLSYFNLDRATPLIVDEWNFDRNVNILPGRKAKSYIAASYVPSRIKNMLEAGLDNQVYFSLEDFQGNSGNVSRNTGAFYFDTNSSQYKGGPKAIYNAFRMISRLGREQLPVKLEDEFLGILASRSAEGVAVLIYNYIDPEIVKNYLAQNIAALNPSERGALLNIIRTNQLDKFINRKQEISSLRSTPRVAALLTKAQALNDRAREAEAAERNLKIVIKGLKEPNILSRYVVDSSCAGGCDFKAREEKDLLPADNIEEVLKIAPYSVQLIVLKKKPAPEPVQPADEDASGQ